MDAVDKGQVTRNAAEIYEEFFVPALFQQWAARVADATQLQPGQRVLDVACGTGVLARAAAARVGMNGSVVGVDVNEGMLAVAARKAPNVEWHWGKAESLQFDDDSFDVVVSQFGLMFFEDRRAALQEMMRVLRPGGQLAVAVWASLDETPGYQAMAALLLRLFGEQAADGIRVPFVLGNTEALSSLFEESGISPVKITTPQGTARFPSIEDWVFTDVKGWVLADQIDETQYALLLREAKQVLMPFVAEDGSVAFNSPAHIITAVKG